MFVCRFLASFGSMIVCAELDKHLSAVMLVVFEEKMYLTFVILVMT